MYCIVLYTLPKLYQLVLHYLIHVVDVDGGVEHRVEVVEQIDHLHGRAHGRDGGEADDVAEVDGHLVEALRLHALARLQVVRHDAKHKRRLC